MHYSQYAKKVTKKKKEKKRLGKMKQAARLRGSSTTIPQQTFK
jgi:hypothetical protein